MMSLLVLFIWITINSPANAGGSPATVKTNGCAATPHSIQQSAEQSAHCLPLGQAPLLSDKANELGQTVRAIGTSLASSSAPDLLFDSILTRFKDNPCRQDKTQIRHSVLNAMLEAFRFRGFPEQAISNQDWESEGEFKKKLAELWETFGTFVSKDHPLLPYFSYLINRGGIPVPSTGHPEHFTYTSLRTYYYLGISPVDIEDLSEKELANRDEHPILASALESPLRFLLHDIQHATVLGASFAELGLHVPEKCEKFLECMRSIPGEADKNNPVRKGLYYLLHEDNTALTVPSSLFELDQPFLEFALENTIHRDGLSISNLMGANAPDFNKHSNDVCAAIHELKSNIDSRQILFSHLIPFSELEKHLAHIRPYHEVKTDGIGMGMLEKMSARCKHYPTTNTSIAVPDTKKGIEFLTIRFQNAKTASGIDFHDTFLAEVKRLYNSIYAVLTHISSKKTAACHEFNFPDFNDGLAPPFN